MSESNICFVDFETTGIDVFRDEPIEIGAVLINDKLEIIKEFSSKISLNKSVYHTKRAYNIHNISIDELYNAPTQKEVLTNFYQELGTEYRLGGWNISFDASFLRKLSHKNGMMVKYNKINYRHLDVQTISNLAIELNLISIPNNSLSDLITYFNLNRRKYHSAIEDTKLTVEVYIKLLKLFKNKYRV